MVSETREATTTSGTIGASCSRTRCRTTCRTTQAVGFVHFGRQVDLSKRKRRANARKKAWPGLACHPPRGLLQLRWRIQRDLLQLSFFQFHVSISRSISSNFDDCVIKGQSVFRPVHWDLAETCETAGLPKGRPEQGGATRVG